MMSSLSLLLFRNRRSGQGDRLSGVSVALQYGSESEDDPVLSGKTYQFAQMINVLFDSVGKK